MIIKSHIRGGIRAAADYMKDQGLNEVTRVVEISDPEAKDLDDAFHNMWIVSSKTKATKPLHHISINPMKDERLTDKQVLAIVRRCEEKYGYKMFHHQRVIVEHVKDGRQHFHVIWNRVSLMTGVTVWPGEHWKKSKQVCREMEKELGLKRPTPRRTKRPFSKRYRKGKYSRYRARDKKGRFRARGVGKNAFILPFNPAQPIKPLQPLRPVLPQSLIRRPLPRPASPSQPIRPEALRAWLRRRRMKKKDEDNLDKIPFRRPEWETAELIHWAFENGRLDILAYCGITLPPDYFEP